MTDHSDYHNEHANKWLISHVMRFMLAGMVIGAILMFLILNVTNTPTEGGTAHCEGTTDNIDDSMQQLNDDTLLMMKDAFKWGGGEVGFASSGELGRLPFRIAFSR